MSQLTLAEWGKLRVWEWLSWCVGRLLRMGCDSLVMPLCGSVGSGEPGSRMGYHRNILLRTNGGRRGRDRKPNSVERKGRGRDRKPDFVACSAQIVDG